MRAPGCAGHAPLKLEIASKKLEETRVRGPSWPCVTQYTHSGENMTVKKRMLLGSAAALTAISSTQAADLPVKAKPVEYVKICSLYGEGFFYIPGTDICRKLGEIGRP